MRGKTLKIKWLIAILMLSIFLNISCVRKNEPGILLLPVLPKPIAKEPVLITSAGQSTDTYIIKDIANQLMIHNFFMPQARETNIKDINTLVFVVGYSPLGEELHNLSFENEKSRIVNLLDSIDDKNLAVLTVFIGGRQRRNSKNDELLKLICPRSHYIIGTREANYDNFLGELAQYSSIPLTLVKNAKDISEPFASAFR